MTKKTVFIIVIAAFVVFGGYFLFAGGGHKQAPIANTEGSATESAANQDMGGGAATQNTLPPADTAHVVTYTDNGYSPNTITIKPGETVTFKNESSRALWVASAVHPTHTAYSGTSLSQHCADPLIAAFDACAGTQPGGSWSFTFTKIGTWQHHNHLMPSDAGMVMVIAE